MPTAMVKHEPASLSKNEQRLLNEALRRGEETRDAVEDALVSYGRWILVNVFDDDAARVFDDKQSNPVWMEILRRAGGPTLRLSRRLLYVGVYIAAHDKRINDDSWRALDAGRKELLLPLADEGTMRKAARQVLSMKMSQDATRMYVATLRAQQGKAPAVRLTAPRLTKRLRTLRESIGSARARKRLEKLVAEIGDEDRAALRDEVSALKEWLDDFSKTLRRR